MAIVKHGFAFLEIKFSNKKMMYNFAYILHGDYKISYTILILGHLFAFTSIHQLETIIRTKRIIQTYLSYLNFSLARPMHALFIPNYQALLHYLINIPNLPIKQCTLLFYVFMPIHCLILSIRILNFQGLWTLVIHNLRTENGLKICFIINP